MKSLYVLVALLAQYLAQAATLYSPETNASLLLQKRATGPRGVFAHFMVGNVHLWQTSDWEGDIKLAQDAHIDAFVLNIAVGEKGLTQSLINAFAAANNKGFKLFFSFDYAGGGPWDAKDVLSLLNQYRANAAYYKFNGQPLVSTFEGPDNAPDWVALKQATGAVFIPSYSSLGAKAAVATGVVDGLFSWAGWPWGNTDMDTYVDASYRDYLGGAEADGGMLYMMPVSPWFFTNLPQWDKNWLWRGDDLWYDRWEEVMAVQPQFIEIITWNDFGESHYIGPLHDGVYDAFASAPYNYALNMPHDGWRLFLPYVIDAYKNPTAKPSITREGLVTWYRRYPKAACTSGGTTGNTASQLQVEFYPADVVQDKVFYSALLASPGATVTVTIGGVSQVGTWENTPDGGVGIYHGSVDFNGVGDVVVTLSRGGTIASVVGASITTSCPQNIQNWNAWVGSASGGAIAATSPALSLSNQVCVKGKGVGNFAGLCDFACHYGYCPIGACTCTLMGAPIAPPKSTGVKGYPLAGASPSYEGLCDFICNLGYCPDTACGLVKAPLTLPTVSEFLPFACTSGTGVGNLAGLCDYSCHFGYCPISSCVCSGRGGLNLPPPVISGKGYAAPSQDAALYDGVCNFACSRGYCPEGACMQDAVGVETQDGTCGAQNGNTYCGMWSGGSCCNANGGCGSDTDDCGTGCQSGPCLDGSGTGNFPSGVVLIDPSIWDTPADQLEFQCLPPCVLVLPTSKLPGASTVTFAPWVTSINIAWLNSATTVVSSPFVYTSTAYVTVTSLVTTTILIPPVTITAMEFWNINITNTATTAYSIYMVQSIQAPPIVITDNPLLGHPGPVIRTVTPPPSIFSTKATTTQKDDSSKSMAVAYKSGHPKHGCAIPAILGGCGGVVCLWPFCSDITIGG
ncbi:hypothetical protein IFR05_015680, partial [Cadophora sp. M221]